MCVHRMELTSLSGADRYPVLRAELQTFAYATEDVDKVEKALTNLLGDEVSSADISYTELHGHFKDPITIIKALVKRKRPATQLFMNIIEGLSTLDYSTLLDELDERVDSTGNLYIRFDKQKAFRGDEYLNILDPIRVKFHFRVPHKVDPSEYIRSVIEERSVA